jgi:predicted RNase H-like nuclease (RuvC/YqgF family)
MQVPFWDINVGNLLTLAGILLQGLLLWAKSNSQHGENKRKIEELMEWKNKQEKEQKELNAKVAHLDSMASGMKASSEGLRRAMDNIQSQLNTLINREHSSRRNDRG